MAYLLGWVITRKMNLFTESGLFFLIHLQGLQQVMKMAEKNYLYIVCPRYSILPLRFFVIQEIQKQLRMIKILTEFNNKFLFSHPPPNTSTLERVMGRNKGGLQETVGSWPLRCLRCRKQCECLTPSIAQENTKHCTRKHTTLNKKTQNTRIHPTRHRALWLLQTLRCPTATWELESPTTLAHYLQPRVVAFLCE